jgi:hypothetical protein
MRPQIPLRVKAFQVLFIAVVLLLWSATAFAYPTWYDPVEQQGIKPGIPDFYQHQPIPGKIDEGWCWETAFENSIYYWDKQYPEKYGKLYDDPADPEKEWLDGMVSNLKEITNTPGADGAFMTNYLKKKTLGPDNPEGLFVSPYTDTGNDFYLFNVYQEQLLACQDVLIYLIDPTKAHGWWWSSTYHVLTGVGVDCDDYTIAFADPDNTLKGSGYYNDKNQWIDTGGKYKPEDKFPCGKDWKDVGPNNYYQQSVIDKNGILQDIYPGAKISRIYTICPVPEPCTLLLLGSGVAGIIGFGRKRLFKKA